MNGLGGLHGWQWLFMLVSGTRPPRWHPLPPPATTALLRCQNPAATMLCLLLLTEQRGIGLPQVQQAVSEQLVGSALSHGHKPAAAAAAPVNLLLFHRRKECPVSSWASCFGSLSLINLLKPVGFLTATKPCWHKM